MPLESGSHLGPYQILNPLGAGGMGEVYRARDTKLGRDVALKVLPAALAQDRERISRFTREAQLSAALNHPNIAAIYGVEEAGGGLALVLEYINGETLAERINKGPIPIEEVLRIALQIAQALEAAHEKTVIHRDLKPANIKITAEGTTKVLDFGLAKALQDEPLAASNLSQSATMSIGATGAGMILGTAGYMAPEQARGLPVDRRADIWAFGVVLFEMLTARSVFEGQTVADTLVNVLQRQPDWTQLPPQTPLALRKLVQRCLAKNPKDRIQAIGDARISLEDLIANPAELQVTSEQTADAYPLWKKRAIVATSASESFPEFSPDGKWLAYVSNESGRAALYVQSYPGPGARVTVNGDGPAEPAWSKNSNELFFRQGRSIFSVRFKVSGTEFIPDNPVKLFEQPALGAGTTVRATYDVGPDGRFLLNLSIPESAGERALKIFPSRLRLVLNWMDETVKQLEK